MQRPECVLDFQDSQASGLCEAGFRALIVHRTGEAEKIAGTPADFFILPCTAIPSLRAARP